MTQHTPGPWDTNTLTNGDIQVQSKEYGLLAIVFSESDASYSAEAINNIARETRANARLIAAAPDLLDAVDYVVEELTRDRSPCGDSIFGGSDITYFQAAIAKARP